MAGDLASFRKYYEDFLALWKDADSDLPVYKQAKAKYARVAQVPSKLSSFPESLRGLGHQRPAYQA